MRSSPSERLLFVFDTSSFRALRGDDRLERVVSRNGLRHRQGKAADWRRELPGL